MNSESIISQLAEICISLEVQLVTAESCTGGLVAKMITDLAGSSQWFDRGFVTYSNLAKEQMIGVDADIIKLWGAVSEPVAIAMAKGALEHSIAHYALSITGIAGPDGGSEKKPVGTVCFAWAFQDKVTNQLKSISMTKQFPGDREAVRNQSADFSLHKLYQLIQKNF
ncbi:MAG: CinA family protein [gamma proteobacterium symbiont of Taylorina sp.]|nr:CinA family protein [gamma proteobacterium symbiont of Taylorina sp.]